MKRILRRLGIALAAFLVIAQLVPVDRTNPPVESDVPAPPEVKAALRSACYDCHSNETVWPWYSRVAPASWLLAHDVVEGRAELNFSTWQRYDAKRQQKKLKETVGEMNEAEMPPWYYVIVHPDARLDEPTRQALLAWAREGAGPAASAAAGDGE